VSKIVDTLIVDITSNLNTRCINAMVNNVLRVSIMKYAVMATMDHYKSSDEKPKYSSSPSFPSFAPLV
jgi:hypothetical protein